MDAAAGRGIPVVVDHLDPAAVRALVGRIDCWRPLVEVQDAGRPADPTGCR